MKAAEETQAGINKAMKTWYTLARQEWGALAGTSLTHKRPHFVWAKAAGESSKAGETASTLALAWRQLARRAEDLRRIGCLPGNRTTGQTQAYHGHIRAIHKWAKNLPKGVPEADATQVRNWAEHVNRSRSSESWQAIHSLVKLADIKAEKLEQQARTQRTKEWRVAVGGASSPSGTKTPTRLAFRWLKGLAGWTSSPIGTIRQNDSVPDEPADSGDDDDDEGELVDDFSPGAIHTMPRVRTFVGSETEVPLNDQATVDMEADTWAKLWDEKAVYSDLDFGQPEALDDLMLHAFKAAAASFPLQTGVGADNIAPRALLRLSDEALLALMALLVKMEKVGNWADELDLVLIVLLDKADGGRRPIGLFPTVIRVWMRARAAHARAWESANASRELYGSAGMGAQRAAWVEAFCAESAALESEDHAQALMDLTKAFETVPHDALLDAAKRRGFPLALLRMSIAAYRLKRVVGIDGVYSRQIRATKGITAGSGFATTELRLLLLDVIQPTKARWGRFLRLTLYVDDLTISIRGARRDITKKLAAAVDFVTEIFEGQLNLSVSRTKSVVVASKPAIAREVAKRTSTKTLKKVKTAKLLGTAAAGGKRRSTQIAAKRLSVFKKCLKRMWSLRHCGANTKQMARAAGTSSICYGDDTQGVADSVLNDRRSVLARAAAPAGSGKNPLKILYVLDGAGGTLDPSFDAHVLPAKHWALAWWEHWVDTDQLERAYTRRHALPTKHRAQWARVAGPTAALDMSLQRIGWRWVTASTFEDHSGATWDCRRDPPAAIVKAMKRAVKKHRLEEVASSHPDLIPEAADVGNGRSAFGLHVIDFAATVARLATGKTKSLKETPEWETKHASALVSTMTNGQWTQARRFAVKKWEIATDLCQLCKEEVGTQLHRRKCKITTPVGGWSCTPVKARLAASRIGQARRELLDTTGLLTIKVPNLEPLEKDTFRWYSDPPDTSRTDLQWVIDGSALNSRWHSLATYGFGIVVFADCGDLVAWGGGRPPAWIDSASASEAWALATVTSLAPWEPKIITDCLGLLHTAEAGVTAATRSSKQLARTWAIIAGHLDRNISEMVTSKRLRWMPAHQGPGAIGVAIKSDGTSITVLEWRANRLVDAIAKAEASRGVAPQGTIDLLISATALVQHTAAQIGAATHAANNHVIVVQLESGKTVNKTVRDVQEAPKKRVAKQVYNKAAAPAVEVQPSAPSDWDTDDEEKAYGPNTKRARRAQQKKQRKTEDEHALNRVLADATAKLKPSTRVVGSSCEATEAAAATLTEAASANEVPCTAVEELAAATKERCTEPNPATQGKDVAATAKGQFWPVISSSTASFLGAVPLHGAEAPSRSRPVKADKRSHTRATDEAVQSLLGAQRYRHGFGEEPRRKSLQGMENQRSPVL